MLKNKKAISETISFVLLILLVLVSSIVVYKFSTNMMEEKKIDFEYKKMNLLMKRLNYKLQELKNFDKSSFTFPINLEMGNIIVVGNELKYLSKKEFYGANYCLDEICYSGNQGYEIISLMLDNGYQFESTFSIIPGNYIIKFENDKNISKIKILVE